MTESLHVDHPAIVALCLTALVVLAGCSALGGGAAGSPTDSPTSDHLTTTPPTSDHLTTTPPTSDAPTTTLPTDDATPGPTSMPTVTPSSDTTPTPDEWPSPTDAESLPPGVHTDGTVNETALLSAHAAALNGTTWRGRHRNGNTTRLVVKRNDTAFVRTDTGTTWGTGDAWTTGRLQVTNDTLVGPLYRVSYVENGTMISTQNGGTLLFALGIRLLTGEFRWNGTRTVDSERYHELVVAEQTGIGDSLGHLTGTMLVDESGRIRELRGRVGDNATAAQPYRYAFEWEVASVPRPDWFDAVPRGEAEKVRNGTAFRVRLTGGATVSAGTELEFHHGDVSRVVTLAEPLAPGDSLYLAVQRTDNGSREVVVSRDPPTGDLVDLRGSKTQLFGDATTTDGAGVRLSFSVGRLSLADATAAPAVRREQSRRSWGPRQ